MPKCPECGKFHAASHAHFKAVKRIRDDKHITGRKDYETSHEAADKAEKAQFGTAGYDGLKKAVRRLRPNELLGSVTRSGTVEVEKKLTPAQRKEVAYHEKIEQEHLHKKKR